MLLKHSTVSHKPIFAVAFLACASIICAVPVFAEEVSDGLDKRFVNSPGLEEYPLANAIFLKDELTYSVTPDGSTKFFEHDAIKMLNNDGVSTYSSLMRVFDSRYEDIKIINAQNSLNLMCCLRVRLLML